MDNIQQTIDEALGYLKGIWIKKRYIIVSTWVICPIAWLYIASMPNVYQSSAKVFADTRSILQPLLRGIALQTNINEELDLMVKTLLSRQNLEKIARNTDLDIQTKNDIEYQALLNKLKKEIKFRPSNRDNIYSINYEHKNANVAKRVVEETLTLFVESTLGSNRQGADTATKFLDAQISEYERRLTASEIRLSDFKRKHSNVLVQSAGGVYGQLSTLSQELETVKLLKKEAESRLSQANTAWENSSNGQTPTSTLIETQYDSRIENLEVRLDDLLIRYTERHPDVVESRQALKNLQALRQSEIAAYQQLLSNEQPDLSNIQGRVGEELVITIQTLKNELASLNVREQSYEEKIADLTDKMDLIPQIEAEMVGLNRDYDITRSKHEELLNRRESVLMSQQADLETDDVQFRIIEPPLKAIHPSGPKRIILYTVVLIFGVGVGATVAFVLSQVTPVFFRASQLTSVTGFPVLGCISHVSVEELNRVERKKNIVFWVSNAFILIGFSGFVLIELMGYKLNLELMSKLFNAVSQII